ncbi:hypothetical protein DFQ28_010848 [Apophysomyces sp. BC1034]|nr:hypothetical protein DFQ30_008676 [Apophysomyces sp. BC1015]KAG0176675.1 hypothetical protein DFQ29_005826 [Apophysomyces sp. BC1021]KAG0191819.1 hypothetical protein DFQ28_010848 [Apophysomyces sp. BC1034]
MIGTYLLQLIKNYSVVAKFSMLDMAMEFPQTQVVGIDICDIFLADLQLPGLTQQRLWQDDCQPGYLPKIVIRRPGDEDHSNDSNIIFEVGNILDGLPFPDNTFTLVHMRQMVLSLTLPQWKQVLSELARVTKPGGYIQLVEADIEIVMTEQPAVVQKTIEAFRRRGLKPEIASRLDELLQCVGFEEVNSKYVSMPIGDWGLELGSLWQHNVEELIKSLQPQLSPILCYKSDQWDSVWEDAICQMNVQKAFNNIHAAWGRKPLMPTGTHWDVCSLFGQLSCMSEDNCPPSTETGDE